jgi:hypothetical protein
MATNSKFSPPHTPTFRSPPRTHHRRLATDFDFRSNTASPPLKDTRQYFSIRGFIRFNTRSTRTNGNSLLLNVPTPHGQTAIRYCSTSRKHTPSLQVLFLHFVQEQLYYKNNSTIIGFADVLTKTLLLHASYDNLASFVSPPTLLPIHNLFQMLVHLRGYVNLVLVLHVHLDIIKLEHLLQLVYTRHHS